MNRRAFAKRVLAGGAALWVPQIIAAPPPILQRVISRPGKTATQTAPSYLYQQDFESGAEPSGWSNNGADYAYATSPAPLLGNYSLNVVNKYARYQHGSDLSEVYGFFLCSFSVGDDSLLSIRNVFDDAVCLIGVSTSGGQHSLYANVGGSAITVNKYTVNTKLWVWFYFKQGTGSDAIGKVWVSTTGNKPADGSNDYAAVTNGTNTTAARRYYFNSFSGSSLCADHFILNDTAIGSNP